MKLSLNSKLDSAAVIPKWKCFDNCPVCRLIKKSMEAGCEINSKEWEEAFSEAGEEKDSV